MLLRMGDLLGRFHFSDLTDRTQPLLKFTTGALQLDLTTVRLIPDSDLRTHSRLVRIYSTKMFEAETVSDRENRKEKRTRYMYKERA